MEAYSINTDAEKTTDLAALMPRWGHREEAACQLAKGTPGREGTAASVRAQRGDSHGIETVLFRFVCVSSVLFCGVD